MPAKKVIHKQTILNEAFALVQENGIDALNMRSLAKRCKCSTQPIYLSYKGLDELKKDIFQKLIERFDKCIEDEIALKKYPEYKAVGMGYIRFAKEEKELFKLLMFNNLPSEDLDWQKLSLILLAPILRFLPLKAQRCRYLTLFQTFLLLSLFCWS